MKLITLALLALLAACGGGDEVELEGVQPCVQPIEGPPEPCNWRNNQ